MSSDSLPLTRPTALLDHATTPLWPISTPQLAHLSDHDRQRFWQFGFGPIEAPRHTTIHRPIELHAISQPDAIAAEHEGSTITYGHLDAQADRLAALLLQLGVTPGDNVALFVQRSIPMLVGILATLKVGAAYVPQDARVAPDEQLRHVAASAETRVILTLSSLRDQIPSTDRGVVIAIDEVMNQPIGQATGDSPIASIGADSDRNCFVLFTSGTTGSPNGVQVTHRNLCNILLTNPGDLGMRPGMKVSQILSISFDMAAWEILGCLSHGATLLIRGKEIQATAERADIVIATPSVLGTLDADRCRQVRVAAVAGEPCPRSLADEWSKFATFYNSCGPTETTIINTAQRYDPNGMELTIGTPTPNNTVYVLDDDLRAVPIGEVGEMWAGGDCVTGGYLGNEQLTSDRYRPDPFIGGGAMMFRTRDLGRWTSDGNLEHLGRTDDQVKIRGFRVELDSVSGALESAATCAQAVTLKYDHRNLVAFVTPASADIDDALAHVGRHLPYYCAPAHVIAIESFPMTDRGKVDKRALLEMAHAPMHGAVVAS